jgi:bifunctional DNA-binding transcriptional regulator/antitoxin component of YhaV-PrlF toxin-antitoxin module
MTYKDFVRILQELGNVKIRLKVGPQGHIYFPKKIREMLGEHLTLLPNAHVAIIYPENADPEAIMKSLRLLIQDLKLSVEEKEAEDNEQRVSTHE